MKLTEILEQVKLDNSLDIFIKVLHQYEYEYPNINCKYKDYFTRIGIEYNKIYISEKLLDKYTKNA